jgi:predicted HAD superfamily Cof-like phosphohydrolase
MNNNNDNSNDINSNDYSEDFIQNNYKELLETGKITAPNEDNTYKYINQIKDFNDIFNVSKGVTIDNLELRLKLMEEEFIETTEFMRQAIIELRKFGKVSNQTSCKILDGLVDQTVINIGTSDVLGYDFDGAWHEIMSSNLSKINKDGTVSYREDGKILKGDLFREPELEQFINVSAEGF